MCWEDYRIGAKIQSAHKHTTLTGGTDSVASSSNNRVFLLLSGPTTGTITYDVSPVITAGQGIMLLAGVPPLLLTLKDHGLIVQKEWFAVGSAAGLISTVYEGALPDELLEEYAYAPFS